MIPAIEKLLNFYFASHSCAVSLYSSGNFIFEAFILAHIF